ncbi:MAG: hypothetical protein GX777_07750 [Fastidiosipila sp.]|nr:hypothetical protein [Fastidiosipila sp.]
MKEITDMRGRLEVKPSDLEGRGSGHPLYRIFFIMTKSINAVDFANGSYIGNTIGSYHSIQSHHLFPKAYLQRNGYETSNLMHVKQVNEIGNRAFITRDTNYSLSDRSPDDYLPEIAERYPSVFDDHFIPQNREFWKLENYGSFLEERRRLIAEGINNFIKSFYKKYERTEYNGLTSYIERIRKGEDNYTEFKSSLQYSMHTDKHERHIEYAIVKSIAGFLNSNGGRLFVGVDDAGNILGLDKDFSLYRSNSGFDEFRLRFDNIIRDYIGSENSVYLTSEFIKIDDKDIFVVTVSRSNSPCYVPSMDKTREEFYVRQAASTQPLSLSQTTDYINNRFSN